MLLIFITSTIACKRHTCHTDLTFKNNSPDTVIVAFKAYNNGNCSLDAINKIAKAEFTYSHYSNCLEDEFSNGKTLDIYFVDPAKFNKPSIFYNCDSIEIKNKVLKHVVLTLDEFEASNFTVSYP